MAVNFVTSNPSNLLAEFKKRIKQSDSKGKITTWEEDSDGDFTHKSSQWGNRAWMHPVIKSGILTFVIIGQKDTVLVTEVYGFYHGHLTETFLNHFDNSFSTASSTALPTPEDRVTTS